jgi:hypothetical protein
MALLVPVVRTDSSDFLYDLSFSPQDITPCSPLIEKNRSSHSGSNKPSKIPAPKPRLVSYSVYSTLKMEAIFLRNVG